MIYIRCSGQWCTSFQFLVCLCGCNRGKRSPSNTSLIGLQMLLLCSMRHTEWLHLWDSVVIPLGVLALPKGAPLHDVCAVTGCSSLAYVLRFLVFRVWTWTWSQNPRSFLGWSSHVFTQQLSVPVLHSLVGQTSLLSVVVSLLTLS